MGREQSALERQAADALRRARKLPVGPDRNDLRQLALGLLWLHRNGRDDVVEERMGAIAALSGKAGDSAGGSTTG